MAPIRCGTIGVRRTSDLYIPKHIHTPIRCGTIGVHTLIRCGTIGVSQTPSEGREAYIYPLLGCHRLPPILGCHRFPPIVSLSLSSRFRLSQDWSHTLGWLLAPIPNITIRPTSNNNSFGPNYSSKYLSPVTITSIHVLYIPKHIHTSNRCGTIGMSQKIC